MLLRQLIAPLIQYRLVAPPGFGDVEILSVTADSRRVTPGALFIAIRGNTVDGHRFISECVTRGAAAVLVESPVESLPIPQVVVPSTRFASAVVASVFHGHPSQRLQMIGVTGTNGKTTVTHLIEAILQAAGRKVGLYGTVGMRVDGRTEDVVNTTPEAVDLQHILHRMVRAGCQYGVMEVSSHALELHRVAGTRFHIGVFTNLTQDHLDFHGTMERYLEAKGKLFSRLGNEYGDDVRRSAYAVLNADDAAYDYLRRQTVVEVISYGLNERADVRAERVQVTADGVSFDVRTFAGDATVRLQMTGRFNVYNALAALSVALIEGIPLQDAVDALAAVPGIPGRLEKVDEGQPFTVLVDYSHTPDSLENALTTVREFATGRVLTVVGCGGDRDRGKRPLMANIAVQHSDLVVLTSDNPRTEDPEAILDDMEAGVAGQSQRYRRITDRAAAIDEAVRLAEPGDVVLIAGKGHETYQIVGTVKHHFDDRETARKAILKWRRGW
ncbi:UDP-N-acetylmuramoyl-L-alanyl-D-glutamate--2,6-diaminopimelate ligase [Alicyclobacillus contaminans]|uniref:UDP-N-acetylmuramoyl-L-alanyl-D-glutamate--2, 6-diaminopimelate ligase n=1 Tax=Alicyclobacillus contaminans TaxID=392016 RepID=UPI00040931C4|nr:UDP-N-acetylmuramoyl-L-alanyl-D-glutamate--2,6-diaminopimelate ligase [Alicyclobacillus contaminans]GMA49173.1 UDP-N-acetylmuramoyl-L-alanyl-D-glutamate--2,6-diaminopimelate ligase [Alicyclobacillus contaminans]